MKLLHCADLHLDSPMRGLARYDGAPLDVLRGATRRAFERAVDLAVDERVGVVVVAGDLYDGDRDDFQTAVFLQRQLHRLRDAGIRVVLVYGNHDAENEITKRLSVPANTHVLASAAPESVVFDDLGIAFHGQSYRTRTVDEDLSAHYPGPVPGLLNVGVLHTSLDGRPGHARYAPCTVDGLVRRGYQYWALGHVHQREQLERDGVTIVFPGNLCGRDVGEPGSKGATLLEYDGDQVTAVRHHDLAPVRWHHLAVDAHDAAGVADLSAAVMGRLEEVRDVSSGTLDAVRLTITASPRAFAQWLRDAEQCELQLRADSAGGDTEVWLERIDVRQVAPPRPGAPDDARAAIAESLAALQAEEDGTRRVAELLTGVRSRFGAEREAAVRLGALGLDDTSVTTLLEATRVLLDAELGGGA